MRPVGIMNQQTQANLRKAARWRKAALVVSLMMVLLAALFVMLLSRGVDKELYALSNASKIAQNSALVILNLVKMQKQAENFRSQKTAEAYLQFLSSSQKLQALLSYIKTTEQNYSNDLKQAFAALEEKIKAKIISLDSLLYLNDDTLTPLFPRGNIAPFLASNDNQKLEQSMLDFIEYEKQEIRTRQNRLDSMRAGLSFAAIIAIVSTFILAYGVIDRFRRDLRDSRSYQDLLHNRNSQLEARVQERTKQLETARAYAEKERDRVELLLQDTSHRIGNSLATVSSLLGVQANRSKNADVKSALLSARQRIQNIATAHRRLRLGTDMETAEISDFLRMVIQDIEAGMSSDLKERVQILTHLSPFNMLSRDATTLGIVMAELLTNAIKHAFPGKKRGVIEVFFGKNSKGILCLIIKDNGVGIKEDQLDKEDIGLGKLVAKNLCIQFNTIPLYERLKTAGTQVTISLEHLATAYQSAESSAA